MILLNRRVLIAGSANASTDKLRLEYTHNLVREICRRILQAGGGFCVNVGREPVAKFGDEELPITFDWTILDAANCELAKLADGQRLLFTVLPENFSTKIPENRKEIWNGLQQKGAVELEYLTEGWSSGAVRRSLMARRCDLLVAVSGGEGVEHLAQEFIVQGKPVIPLDIDLGSSSNDGTGGAARLYKRALREPDKFVSPIDRGGIAARFSDLSTANATKPIVEVGAAFAALIAELESPKVFYVRLLNRDVPECAAVEKYFRQVVDPFVTGLGFQPVQMGLTPSRNTWMNVEIFERLQFCSFAVVDLTGVRPDCLVELGFVLGKQSRFILTAQKGTRLTFDTGQIEYHPWSDPDDSDEIIRLREYWMRNVNRLPIVTPSRIP